MDYDYLIVGQGLAGTLLSYQLIQQHQRILVIDESVTHTSSKIAAGMFTPLSGKRLAKSWMAEELLPYLKDTYARLEVLLAKQFIHYQPIQIGFSSVKEQNDFYSNRPIGIAPYLKVDAQMHPGLHAPLGGFEVLESGWLNTASLLDAFRAYLTNNKQYLDEAFDYTALSQEATGWRYKNYRSKGVIFCEGYKNYLNPFFGNIPIIPNRGDVFSIQTPCLGNNKIYKRGVYAVCKNNGHYKVGSTYHWDNASETPDKKGFNELKNKTDFLINGAYTILQHQVGIRPTTRDRRPVLGQHATLSGLYLFNGLGTKGVMLAPYFSNLMALFILLNKELPEEVNLKRFNA